jgi:hypothetical protein
MRGVATVDIVDGVPDEDVEASKYGGRWRRV